MCFERYRRPVCLQNLVGDVEGSVNGRDNVVAICRLLVGAGFQQYLEAVVIFLNFRPLERSTQSIGQTILSPWAVPDEKIKLR